MTTAADDRAVEDAFEAYLAGRPVPDAGAALASFAGAVRATATQPGRPDAALAELLATGLLADQPSPSARTARSAGTPPSRGTRIRNRRRLAMFFPALIAKFLSAGALAQAATGAGAALVVVTGAGVVGVLPDPVQDTVATAIETVTPLDLEGGDETGTDETGTDGAGTGADAGAVPAATATTTAPAEPTEGAPAEGAFDVDLWDDGPVDGESFGAWVSEGAHNKAAIEAAAALRGAEDFRFGHLVRAFASAKHVDIADVEVDGVALEELIATPPTTAPEATQPTTAPAQETASATRGRGNGNASGATNGSNGNGNSGNGGQGSSKGNGRNCPGGAVAGAGHRPLESRAHLRRAHDVRRRWGG